MADEAALEMEERNGDEEVIDILVHQNDNSVDSTDSLGEKKNVPRAALTFMEVKSIVAASFGEDGRRCYKVNWRDSWVYDDHLFGCSELVEKFWNEQKNAKEKEENKNMVPRRGIKRKSSNKSKNRGVTVIVIGKDKESNETPPTPEEADVRGRQSATSEGGVKGDWMPDAEGIATDEETKENFEEWTVDSRTKKIRPMGREYTLKCHVCSEEFDLVTAFKKHYIDQHPGVKPFACDMCDKRFDRKENLSRHIRIHTGDRRYVCNYCGKGYTDPSGLKKHVFSKHSGMKFDCDICSVSYKSKEALSRHLTKHLSDHRLKDKKDNHYAKKKDLVLHPEDCQEHLPEQSTTNGVPPAREPVLLDANTNEDTSIVLLTDETDQGMSVVNQIESESSMRNNLKTTESLQNVVDQLQQFVDAEGGEQVVHYVQQISHTSNNEMTGVRTGGSVLTGDQGTVLNENGDGKQFIFAAGEAHQIIPITMTSSGQNNLPLNTHQVLPVVATPTGPNQAAAQLITVPIATSQAFVYTGAITPDGGTPETVIHQGRI